MNPSPEEFEKLRVLLTLKRHEQPPPGYFNQLPGKIISRIEAGESAPSFWQRVSAAFIIKPSYAYSLGLMLCGALAVGSFYSFHSQPTRNAPAMAVQPAPKQETPAIAATTQPSGVVPVAFVSTNPAVTGPKVPTLFDRSTQQPVVPASFER